MAIAVTCGCGQRYEVPDTMAGRRVKCRKCEHVLEIPRPSVTAAVDVTPLDDLFGDALPPMSGGAQPQGGTRTPPAGTLAPAAAKKKGKKRKSSSGPSPRVMWTIGAVAALLVLLPLAIFLIRRGVSKLDDQPVLVSNSQRPEDYLDVNAASTVNAPAVSPAAPPSSTTTALNGVVEGDPAARGFAPPFESGGIVFEPLAAAVHMKLPLPQGAGVKAHSWTYGPDAGGVGFTETLAVEDAKQAPNFFDYQAVVNVFAESLARTSGSTDLKKEAGTYEKINELTRYWVRISGTTNSKTFHGVVSVLKQSNNTVLLSFLTNDPPGGPLYTRLEESLKTLRVKK